MNPQILTYTTHRAAIFALIGIFVLISIIYLSPKYLTVASATIHSDAIVLMAGPIFELRKKEALKIFEQGFARYLLLPSTGEVWEHQEQSKSFRKSHFSFPATINQKYRRYYEGTHIEILRTKKMMQELGLTSAIFVSSPYHMRRIQIIANREIDAMTDRLAYVPATEHRTGGWKWWLSRNDWWWVANEYVKIGWLLVSRNFLLTV